MPETPRPLLKKEAPDPADVYERAHPEREAGMGRLDANRKATPAKAEDKLPASVTNAQDGSRQINAHDTETPKPTKNGAREQVGWEQSKKTKKK
jgi:hypothetical protein